MQVPWRPDRNTILVLTKAKDNKLVLFTRQLVEWLIFTPRFGKNKPFIVFVDAHLKHAPLFGYNELKKQDSAWETHLKFWTPQFCYDSPDLFNLIITLGGDGTVLFTSSLFQSKVPPVVPFHLGSLGFLTPFLFTTYKEELSRLFEGQLKSVQRMRLVCTVYRLKTENSSDLTDETAWMRSVFLGLKENMISVPEQTHHVLNEVVVDRGPSANMSLLELFSNNRHLTTVQADGLCIATATGSTAYSLSAGGSLTHPSMQSTLITPISPHALSFRPLVLPKEHTIRIVVPFGSRCTAFCSFDGRNRVELGHGDHIKITISPHPIETYCAHDADHDWFTSIQTSLHWNVRQRQKSFVTAPSIRNQNEFDLLPWSDQELKRHTSKL